ncbi:response regulator transcription factor [Flavobacterium sp. CYK-55]|uniref:response regulator n=1 Tax=Flavobacterium sp. CYK-55 TaxID=2835529 RepID=UPI001BD0E8EF|nr:response regulator transcription factor [Flavobacterium sp. CYK-55]MBS7786021.1 response regulator transcription factor [Flavobacterium sp. CYK-55]
MHILIVDDHPAMIEGYKGILKAYFNVEDLQFSVAFTFEQAYLLVQKAQKAFDIAILDMAMPAFEAQKIFSGEDMARLIMQKFLATKIMIITSHTEGLILYNLIRSLNPDAVLVKSDFQSDDMAEAVQKVLAGEKYYSKSAKTSLKNVGNLYDGLDSYDRRIIFLLAKGIKTKNIPEHLPISLSAVDKRKAKIRLFFDIPKGGSDEDIIKEAQRLGLV